MHAREVLHRLVRVTCTGMHALRREALQAVVFAALLGRCLTVTGLGRALMSPAHAKHCIKRADRLLSNRHLQAAHGATYRAVCGLIVGAAQRPVILIDWSDLDPAKRLILLRAATPVGGRALTLYEEVHTARTAEKPTTHRRFLQRLQALLSAGARPIVVTDAGFRTPWFQAVARLGWDWVGHLRHRHLVQLRGVRRGCPAGRCTALPVPPPAVRPGGLTRRTPIECQLVLYKGRAKRRHHKTRCGKRARSAYSRKHAAREREPWLLATSLCMPVRQLANKVVALFRLRMQIEEAFRDVKSSRFDLGLELSGTRQHKRLQVLLLIGALALLVVWLLGQATQLTGQHRHYQVNSVRDRTVLSALFLGLHVINDGRLTLHAGDIADAVVILHNTVRRHAEAI